MTTFKTLFSRASVRSYTGEPISSEELDMILKAANASPVGMGQYENLHLTVIKNKALLDRIDAAGAALFQMPDSHPLYGAPMMILVSHKKGMENTTYSDAAIVVHNMALAATELGVGNCYIWGATMAMAASPELVQQLNLPEGFIPCCGIVLGKTDYQYKEREIPVDRLAMQVIE